MRGTHLLSVWLTLNSIGSPAQSLVLLLSCALSTELRNLRSSEVLHIYSYVECAKVVSPEGLTNIDSAGPSTRCQEAGPG